MVFVEGGTFTMGAKIYDDLRQLYDGNEQFCYTADQAKPMHSVTLSDFYMGTYEVTQKQWKEIMGNNPSKYSDCDNCPVENVSWDEVQEFIRKLNAKTGFKYRLPTEAEWEFAARGGNKSKDYLFAGSNQVSEVAWYWKNSDNKPHPVGTKSSNELGLYDMLGNVFELCNDWYSDYSSYSQTNPKGPDSGEYRVSRGGSFSWTGSVATTLAGRGSTTQGYKNDHSGFRLAMDAQ
jgi:formylglycine-generating enzyme required for sulfatase activity